MKLLLCLAIGIGLALDTSSAEGTPPAPEADTTSANAPVETGDPIVIIETSKGTIKAELWPEKAPRTVENFLDYVDAEFFDGLIFHRVMSGFMIQGGGFTPAMQQKPTRAPVKNEARADTPNARGTLAMARTHVVDSATSQFFINLVDNTFLNHRNKTPRGFGYCVFGKVIDGMDVVDRIGKVPTGQRGPHSNVPRESVVIQRIRREQEKEAPPEQATP